MIERAKRLVVTRSVRIVGNSRRGAKHPAFVCVTPSVTVSLMFLTGLDLSNPIQTPLCFPNQAHQ